MSATFRCMLATDAELSKLRFPLLASPKLDGVRATVRGGVVYSRSNKPIPNRFVQNTFKRFEHYDGELIVGLPTAHDVMRQTMSGVMSEEGTPWVTLYAFDHVSNLLAPYKHRRERLQSDGGVVVLEQREIRTIDELLAFETETLDRGYEGLILRDPNAPYKMGRSTVREGYLLKLKRMATDEAEIIGFVEEMMNLNEATINELGRTKRSSRKAGKLGKGRLGALKVRWKNIEFEIGTGFDSSERELIWNNQDKFIGKLVSFNHFPIGVKDKPRHPSYKGLRDPIDL